MQLPEAKSMSEWLARYVVIRIQSKSRSRSRPRDKYHVSVTYVEDGFYGRHHDHIVIIARIVLAYRVWRKAVI